MRLDACTAATCDKAWGRTAFAKVLVNAWAMGELQREVEVVIPHLMDDGEDVVTVVVEYEWEPSQCSVCKVFGHTVAKCVKNGGIPQKAEVVKRVDSDGFQKPKRKQWRPNVYRGGLHEVGDTSHVDKKKDAVINEKDTLLGVGTIKRSVEQQSGQKEGGPTSNIVNNCAAKPLMGTELPPRNEGGYCTLNAGRTPGAKEGMAVPSCADKDSYTPNIPIVGGVQAEKASKETPSLLKSVVASFKQFEKVKRGTPMLVTTSNSFEALSSEDSSVDLEVENVND